MDARAWDARYATKDYVWTIEPNRYVKDELSGTPPGRALDLAAGECRNAVWLAKKGWQVIAVDFSTVALEKGRQLAAHHDVGNIDFVVADVTNFDPTGPLDLVLIAYLQIALTPRAALLRRTTSWLGPGGTILVVAYDKTNIEGGYGGPPAPDVNYTVDETVAALGGLVIDSARVAHRTVETPEGDRVALDTVVVAHRRAPA